MLKPAALCPPIVSTAGYLRTQEIKLHLIINYELERLILSYADSVKVLQPALLIRTIKLRLKAAQEIY